MLALRIPVPTLLLVLAGSTFACGEVELDLIASRDGEPCTMCGKTCAKLGEDAKHCGGCDLACAKGEDCCGGSCTSFKDDPANCGACGVTCPAEATCKDGACACPPAQHYCDGVCVLAKESPCRSE